MFRAGRITIYRPDRGVNPCMIDGRLFVGLRAPAKVERRRVVGYQTCHPAPYSGNSLPVWVATALCGRTMVLFTDGDLAGGRSHMNTARNVPGVAELTGE